MGLLFEFRKIAGLLSPSERLEQEREEYVERSIAHMGDLLADDSDCLSGDKVDIFRHAVEDIMNNFSFLAPERRHI